MQHYGPVPGHATDPVRRRKRSRPHIFLDRRNVGNRQIKHRFHSREDREQVPAGNVEQFFECVFGACASLFVVHVKPEHIGGNVTREGLRSHEHKTSLERPIETHAGLKIGAGR